MNNQAAAVAIKEFRKRVEIGNVVPEFISSSSLLDAYCEGLSQARMIVVDLAEKELKECLQQLTFLRNIR